MKHVDLLYSGGLESTYRLVELSQMEDVEVQPYFIVTLKNMKPINFEIRKCKEDIEILRKSAKAKILDLKIYQAEKVKLMPYIKYTKDLISAKYPIGSQYSKFACFGDEKNLNLELCIEKVPWGGRCRKVMDSLINYKYVDDLGGYYVYDGLKDENSEIKNSIESLYKRFIVPYSIASHTKEEIYYMLKELNPEMCDRILFCHNYALTGYTCGKCASCRDYEVANLGFLVEKYARPCECDKNGEN